jgi:hypothetical protein
MTALVVPQPNGLCIPQLNFLGRDWVPAGDASADAALYVAKQFRTPLTCGNVCFGYQGSPADIVDLAELKRRPSCCPDQQLVVWYFGAIPKTTTRREIHHELGTTRL